MAPTKSMLRDYEGLSGRYSVTEGGKIYVGGWERHEQGDWRDGNKTDRPLQPVRSPSSDDQRRHWLTKHGGRRRSMIYGWPRPDVCQAKSL